MKSWKENIVIGLISLSVSLLAVSFIDFSPKDQAQENFAGCHFKHGKHKRHHKRGRHHRGGGKHGRHHGQYQGRHHGGNVQMGCTHNNIHEIPAHYNATN